MQEVSAGMQKWEGMLCILQLLLRGFLFIIQVVSQTVTARIIS